ncbi:hypothetical protein AB0425_31385 [Actinosynnema sp. NPDC051121]|nr:hypothetical protein [Mycobacteriaceae bacterium]
MDEDRTVDPVPPQYRVAWIGGAVCTMTWPAMSRAQYEEWNRQMVSNVLGSGDYVGPKWVPEHLEKIRGPLPGPRSLSGGTKPSDQSDAERSARRHEQEEDTSKIDIGAVLETLRRDGVVEALVGDANDTEAWRRRVRKACRSAGLHVRTGLRSDRRTAFAQLSNRMTPGGRTPDDLPCEIDSIIIEYGSRQYSFRTDDGRHMHQWSASVHLIDDGGEPIESMGHILAHAVEYEQMSDPFSVLDEETADLGHIAGVFFDIHTGELVDELDDKLEPLGSGMLVIDSVHLDSKWRGYGFGPLFVGMVIESLGAGRRFAALQPAPIGRQDAEFETSSQSDPEASDLTARAKLGVLWSQLGFEHFKDDVWVLDLSLPTFPKAMASIRSRVGLI